MKITTDKQARKERPIARGLLDYFPNALAEVANVSFVGNVQHNGPGSDLHWTREKSTDHADCIARHLIERGTIDNDGMRHSAKLAWRALALLQIELEAADKPSLLEKLDACFTTGESPLTYADNLTDEMNQSAKRHKDNKADFWQECNRTQAATIREMRKETETLTEERDAARDAVTRLQETIAVLENRLVNLREEATPKQYFPGQMRALISLGCPEKIASMIVRGTIYSKGQGKWAYIAGPMRGYIGHNFPAFDKARDVLLREGYNVISPADIDRGDHTEKSPEEAQDLYVLRDFWALYYVAKQNGSIVVLPGWERSYGAAGEVFLARWLKMQTSRVIAGKIEGVDPRALVESFCLTNLP